MESILQRTPKEEYIHRNRGRVYIIKDLTGKIIIIILTILNIIIKIIVVKILNHIVVNSVVVIQKVVV